MNLASWEQYFPDGYFPNPARHLSLVSNGVPDMLVYSQLFFYGFEHVLASMAHGIFKAGCCFRVEWRTAGGS